MNREDIEIRIRALTKEYTDIKNQAVALLLASETFSRRSDWLRHQAQALTDYLTALDANPDHVEEMPF